jgi:hypothetical protein
MIKLLSCASAWQSARGSTRRNAGAVEAQSHRNASSKSLWEARCGNDGEEVLQGKNEVVAAGTPFVLVYVHMKRDAML